MVTDSALYRASVMHQRLRPLRHGFRYSVFYLWLDLDDLPNLHRRLRFFSHNRWNLFSYYDRDHLAESGQTTRECLLNFVAAQGFDVTPIATIRLLTFPRILGYIFNPVGFYFLFDAAGQPLCAVAEVTNTFHEQKTWFLPPGEEPGRFRLVAPKHFYVSPFSALDLSFDFRLTVPGETLEIHVNDVAPDGPVLVSSLTGRREILSDRTLLTCFGRYPLQTLRVIFLIHWHALRLWLRRLPWHAKSAQPELQREVRRPHRPSSPHAP